MFIRRQRALVGHSMLAFLVILPTLLRGSLYLIVARVHLPFPFLVEVGGQERSGDMSHPWRPAFNHRDWSCCDRRDDIPPVWSFVVTAVLRIRGRPPSGLADALKKLSLLRNNFINLGPSRIALIESILVRQEAHQFSQQIPQNENKWLPDASVGAEETHTDVLAKCILVRFKVPVPGTNLSPLHALTIVGMIRVYRLRVR